MPIASFESYIIENRLAQGLPIDSLRNSVLGIDVQHYLNEFTAQKNRAPSQGVDGFVTALKANIDVDLHFFSKLDIQPLFVFSGLSIDCQLRRFKAKELSSSELNIDATWNKLTAKQSSANATIPGNIHISNIPGDDELYEFVARDLLQFLNRKDVNYFVSPYESSFQLSYFQEVGLIDAVYGPSDLILTKINKFILVFDIQSEEIKVVDKKKILSELNLSERELMDVCIIVGCSVQRMVFPNLPQNSAVLARQPSSTFRAALDSVHQYMSFTGGSHSNLLGYVCGLHDQNLTSAYLRGVAACEYMPIITEKGDVSLYLTETPKISRVIDQERPAEILTFDSQNYADDGEDRNIVIPNDVHNVISQRLPLEFLFYFSLGLIPVAILESITMGSLYIRPPLAGSNCVPYKQLIGSAKAKKALDNQFNLLTQLLARYYQVKKIEVFYWFDNAVYELNTRMVPSIATCLDKFGVVMSNAELFSFREFWLNFPQSTSIAQFEIERVTKATLLLTSFHRSLFVAGLLGNEKNESNVLSSFKKFVSENSSISEEDLMILFLLLCLISESGINFLTKDLVSPNYSQKTSLSDLGKRESPFGCKSISAISRVCSLKELSYLPSNYRRHVSQSIVAFRSCANVFKERLFNSILVSLVDFIARRDDLKEEMCRRTTWANLVSEIPFYRQLSTAPMGVLSEIYFESALKSQERGDDIQEAICKAKLSLQSLFGQSHLSAGSLPVQVEEFDFEIFIEQFDSRLSLWSSFFRMVEVANQEGCNFLTEEQISMVREADAIFRKFRLS